MKRSGKNFKEGREKVKAWTAQGPRSSGEVPRSFQQPDSQSPVKRKWHQKQLHLAPLHCQLWSGYRKERREVHLVPLHGNSVCASLAEKSKIKKEERKEENAAGQNTKCYKWKKTVLNKSVTVWVKDKKDKQKPGTVYSIPCRYGQLGPGLRNSTGTPGSDIRVSHVQQNTKWNGTSHSTPKHHIMTTKSRYRNHTFRQTKWIVSPSQQEQTRVNNTNTKNTKHSRNCY